MNVCPHCGNVKGQVKAGTNAGRQRYKCSFCRRRYTVETRPRGYPDALRRQAVELHAQGRPIRQISRELGVNHQSVLNWIRRMEENVPVESVSASPAATSTEAVCSGKRRPTISDVARRAGVSTSTISNFLNAKGRMSEATRNRIQAAMEEMHFTPSALVRAIRQHRTHILGVLIFGMGCLDENVSASLVPPLLASIYEAADAAGQDILLYTGWPDRPERNSGLDFLNGHIDGLLYVAPELHTPALERVALAGLPVVTLLARHVPAGVGYVNADNITAMHSLVAHLAELGHRRIAYIAPACSSNFLDRLEGYRQGLERAGLAREEGLERIVRSELWWSAEGYLTELDALLALPAPPTAVIVPEDSWAECVGKAIRARGLRIPQDIALAGFNDTPDAERICGGLTTIRQPFRLIGRTAVERLLALIEGAPVDACRVTVPTELIVRASTIGTSVRGTASEASDPL
jgi:LacI family transcriptional regulator